jgi:drug/metabolite transporter (DMT)-like permease
VDRTEAATDSVTSPSKQALLAHLAALGAVTAWGVSFVATKAALRELSPVTLVFSRFALGVILLHAILAIRRWPLAAPRDSWGALALMGLVGVFVHQMLQVHGLERTTAVRTGWLIGLIPIWSALLAGAFLREGFGLRKILGLGLGLLGATIVITRGRISSELLAAPSTLGDSLILLSTLNWAIYSVIGRGTIRRLGSARATAGSMLLGSAMLAPFYVQSSGWLEYERLSGVGLAALLFLGIVCSGLAYFFWYGALDRLETTRVAAYLYIEPLVTLAASVALLKEPVAPSTIVGGITVLLGVSLVQRS